MGHGFLTYACYWSRAEYEKFTSLFIDDIPRNNRYIISPNISLISIKMMARFQLLMSIRFQSVELPPYISSFQSCEEITVCRLVFPLHLAACKVCYDKELGIDDVVQKY